MKLSKLRASHSTRTVAGHTLPRENTTSGAMRKYAKYASGGRCDGEPAKPSMTRPKRTKRDAGGRTDDDDGSPTDRYAERPLALKQAVERDFPLNTGPRRNNWFPLPMDEEDDRLPVFGLTNPRGRQRATTADVEKIPMYAKGGRVKRDVGGAAYLPNYPMAGKPGTESPPPEPLGGSRCGPGSATRGGCGPGRERGGKVK